MSNPTGDALTAEQRLIATIVQPMTEDPQELLVTFNRRMTVDEMNAFHNRLNAMLLGGGQPPPAAQPWDGTRYERLEAFKDMILSGCTENEYCGPHPGDVWSTIIGECQPCKGSGVVRDAGDNIVDCPACGSSGAAAEPAPPSAPRWITATERMPPQGVSVQMRRMGSEQIPRWEWLSAETPAPHAKECECIECFTARAMENGSGT